MRSSSRTSFLLVFAALVALPLAADARGPKLRAVDESACKRDRDCVFLPAVCKACSPCKPTWRPVGNQAAVRRIRKLRTVASCPKIMCRRCAKASNWLGKKPICARGRCWLSGKPLPKVLPRHGEGGSPCYKACLKSNMARAEGWESIKARCQTRCRAGYQPSGPQQPTRPWSEDRRCKHDRDCVVRPQTPCTCSPCTPTWRRAINRGSLKKLRGRWARMRCALPTCPSCLATWLGTRAVCRKGQCVVK